MTERDAHADLSATTQEAMDIARTSMNIVRTFVPDKTLSNRFRQKAVHSTDDIEFRHLVWCQNDPVVAGARTILDERPIVANITMTKAGVTSRGHDCQVRKATGSGAELTVETGITRTAAAVFELDKEGVYGSATVVVSNASTAALALCGCIENGTRPAAVMATLVGSVKAEKNRKRVRDVADEYSVPAMMNVGKHDESGFAATFTNELVHVVSGVRSSGMDLTNHE